MDEKTKTNREELMGLFIPAVQAFLDMHFADYQANCTGTSFCASINEHDEFFIIVRISPNCAKKQYLSKALALFEGLFRKGQELADSLQVLEGLIMRIAIYWLYDSLYRKYQIFIHIWGKQDGEN